MPSNIHSPAIPYLSTPHSNSRRPWLADRPLAADSIASIAVALDLEATGGPTAPREGRAVFTVYAFKTGGSGTRSLFSGWDDWGGHNRFMEPFTLSKTMEQIMGVSYTSIDVIKLRGRLYTFTSITSTVQLREEYRNLFTCFSLLPVSSFGTAHS